MDELDITSAESKATYAEIKDYVLKAHGWKVSNLYISQVKRKCGIEVGENYNLPKSEDSRQPQCPEELQFDLETWRDDAEGKRLRYETYAKRFLDAA